MSDMIEETEADTVMIKPSKDTKSSSPSTNKSGMPFLMEMNYLHFLSQLAMLKELLLSSPSPHNDARIEALKAEIASGSYEINNQNIALHML